MAKTTERERQIRANQLYGAHALIQRLENKPRAAQARMAEALGVSAAHVSNIVGGTRGMSETIAARLAQNVLHEPWEEYERKAREWLAEHKDSKEAADPSPNRAVASQAARELGLVPEAVAFVLGQPVPDPDHSPQGWMSLMISRDGDLRMADGRAAGRRRPHEKPRKPPRRS